MCGHRGIALIPLGLLLLALTACGGRDRDPATAPGSSAFTPQIAELARPAAVDAQTWKTMQSVLERVLEKTDALRATASAPLDEHSRVDDLSVLPGGSNDALFHFSYHCTADYDQNGEVNISDLTPIGVHFLARFGDANWNAARVADGDYNGEVNIADITPIGVRFLESIDGYLLQTAQSDSPDDNWADVAEIPLSSAVLPQGGGPKQVDYDLPAPVASGYYRVLPFDGSGQSRSIGLPSGAVFFSPGMLAAPTSLTASDGQFLDHVALQWEKSAGATEYLIYRDFQDTAIATTGDVASWDDSGLTDTAVHLYWVRASDGAQLSNFSNEESGYLGSSNPSLDPPTAVQASDGTFTDRITITWTKASGAVDYKIFRDSQSNYIGSAGDNASYDDLALPDALPHTYWVKSVDSGSGESAFSASDTGWQAEEPPVLPAPTDVAATDGDFADHVTVGWTKVTGAVDYKVYRDNQATLLASTGDVASFDDTTLADSLAHMYWVKAIGAASLESDYSLGDTGQRSGGPGGTMVVFGYNDLGMHCMNQSFAELMILPPYNTLHATVIDRSENDPKIVKSGVTIEYSIPGNTVSTTKTDFWDFANSYFGVTLAPNVGLTGNGLNGTMVRGGAGTTDWLATGIPITPLTDLMQLDPYQLALISVIQGGSTRAQTQAVVPVSWEISCNYCHGGAGITPETDILRKHDTMHGTNLENSKPVMCGMCHAQAPLGTSGINGVPSLSGAMHSAHASRLEVLGLPNPCYACHPGFQTQCQRDVHLSKGITCVVCHGDMATVGQPTRSPWVDEPRCDGCHTRAGFEFEQPGTLYRNSQGHMGIACEACHGSTHAIGPATQARDNVQAISKQGHAGVINTCLVCHQQQPGDPFPHRLTGD